MGWKDLSYWLRGGIIGFGVILIIILIGFIPYDMNPPLYAGIIVLGLLNAWAGNIINNFIDCPYGNGDYCIGYFANIMIPLYFIEGFILGALFGWLYGKIKNRGKA